MKRAKRIALGACTALGVYTALLAALSALIVRGNVDEGHMTPIIWAFACLASLIGAKTASAREADPAAAIALCAAAFWAAVQLTGFLVCNGIEPTRAVSLVLPVLTGGALAYLLRSGKEKKRTGRGKRRFHK